MTGPYKVIASPYRSPGAPRRGQLIKVLARKFVGTDAEVWLVTVIGCGGGERWHMRPWELAPLGGEA